MIADADRALFSQAVTDQGAGRDREAEVAYRILIGRGVQIAPVFHNLGLIRAAASDFAESERLIRDALALKPDYAIAWNSLGGLLQRDQRYEEALAAFEEALRRRADYVEAMVNIASLLHEIDRAAEAEIHVERAIALAPERFDAHWIRARLKEDGGQRGEAIASYARALALNPDAIDLRVALLKVQQEICDWQDNGAAEREILRIVKARKQAIEPVNMLYLASDAGDQLYCARARALEVAQQVRPLPPYPMSLRRKKIRIGYLSCDFRHHATSHLAVNLFERHDRAAFEVFAYSYSFDDSSEIRRRVVSAFDRFVEIGAMRDAEAAQCIRDDGVDILVDLKGYTGFARPRILAARPAPLQVNYLGYPGTMGADFIDYIIADPFVIPAGQDANYSEAVVRLPNSYQPNDRRRGIDEAPSRESCGLPRGAFVFCCFNANHKLTAPWFDLWMRILKANPQSVLWLLESTRESAANLRREAAARGVDPTRLVFAKPIPPAAHLARHEHADLFLDTLPYNAHTTMSDSLWAGVPAITCAGETFAGRVGGSLLTAVGLPDMITRTAEEYESLANALAQDPARLEKLRTTLVANRSTAPLFDGERYTRHLETAYRRMWDVLCAGKLPEPLAVLAAERGRS